MTKKKRGKKTYKERFVGIFSGISGSLSFLGGWQVCHNLCLGIIAALALIGITFVGMPLLFLTQYAVFFWSLAALLLIPTLFMYWKNRTCMSEKLVLFNAGIVTASVPFFQAYQIVFWIVGGLLVLTSVFLYLRDRLK
ncbi:MAG: hypothetical protein HYY37_05350 [Candidatus Aenigmarchaeota archaeon]|nr:hypothetical protein [Candidatus Aenigmarchaeota archaeon]